MKTNLRLLGASLALVLLAVTQVPAQEVRQALAESLETIRQAAWWNDPDGSFNPYPAEDTYCGDESCGVCTQCCRPLDMWGQLEFLMWWGKGSHMPPLVTTSVPSTVPQAEAGVLGFPTTQVLLGNERFGDEIQAGFRADFGIWLDQCHNTGAGVRVYGLEGDQVDFFAASTGDPILARPFFNALLQQEDALLIAYTDPMNGPVVDGNIGVNYNTSFVGSDVYLRMMMERCPTNRVDLVGGYTYMRLADNLQIRSNHTARSVLLGDINFDIRDQFATSNVFHGGMLGLMGTRARGRWSIDWLAKASLGSTHQRVRIAGSTTVTPPAGAPVTTNGGFLAQPTNIGDYENSQTVVIPELTTNLHYHFNSNLRLGVGFNALWMSSAVMAGEQIDRAVNPSQIGGGPLFGPPRPRFDFVQDDYWLLGLNMSVRGEF
jgi:hypothetical protein